jgi:hypothetical protein
MACHAMASIDLLKIDIDSADLAIVSALLDAGFAPRLLYAEFNQHVPLPIEFAALEPASGEALNASFGYGGNGSSHYRGFNKIWPCLGTSLAAWATRMTARGYRLVGTAANNVLLARIETVVPAGAVALNTSIDPWCHAHHTHQQLYRLRLTKAPGVPPPARVHSSLHHPQAWPLERGVGAMWHPAPAGVDEDAYDTATHSIEWRCRDNQTPYLLRIPNASSGQQRDWCCPASSRPWFANLTRRAPDYGLCRGCR